MTDLIPPVPTIAVVMTEPPQRHGVERGSVYGGLATVDVMDFAGDLGIHSDFSAAGLDGQ